MIELFVCGLMVTVVWLVVKVLDLRHDVVQQGRAIDALLKKAAKPQVLEGDEWKQGYEDDDDD